MTPRWKTPKLKELAEALVTIKNTDLMLTFLRDLCSIEELAEISSRWKVVQLLDQGYSYREVAKKAGVSTTTVTRIAHFLKHGAGGYTEVLKLKKG